MARDDDRMIPGTNPGAPPRPPLVLLIRLRHLGWHWDERVKGRLRDPRDADRWIEYDPQNDRLRVAPACPPLKRLLDRLLPARCRPRARPRRGRPKAARDPGGPGTTRSDAPGGGGGHSFRLQVLWRSDDLVQIEARVRLAGWWETVAAYTTLEALQGFADGLTRLLGGRADEAGYQAGHAEGLGAIALRVRAAGDPRRVACHLTLTANRPTLYSPLPQSDQSTIDLSTDRPRLDSFLVSLGQIVAGRADTAVLLIESP